MKKTRFYFDTEDAETCYELHHFIDDLIIDPVNTRKTLFKAKRVVGSKYFFCQMAGQVGEKGQSCGKQCKDYNPRNGTSGICKHNSPVHEATDEKITIIKTIIKENTHKQLISIDTIEHLTIDQLNEMADLLFESMGCVATDMEIILQQLARLNVQDDWQQLIEVFGVRQSTSPWSSWSGNLTEWLADELCNTDKILVKEYFKTINVEY